MRYMVNELAHQVVKAWYQDEKICLLTDDGVEIRFPVYKNKILSKATPEQLNDIELICNGTGLHWPQLDEDLSVSGILEGNFG